MKTRIIITIISLFIMIFLGIMFGSSNLTLADFGNDSLFNAIILKVRLPRVLVAGVVGACLSVSGICIQSLLKNPLASPYTLGISSGAGLGATIAIVFNIVFLGQLTIPIFAFIGALLTIFLVINFSKKIDNNLSSETIVLTGMILSLFLGAIISLLMILNAEDTRRIIMFMSGSIATRGWNEFYIVLPFFIVGTTYLFLRSKQLDILTFGENDAHSLGVNVSKLKLEIMVFTSVLTAAAVATCGVIGFVGLVVPHITRKIFGPKHFISTPMAAVFGAMFLIASDLVARTIANPIELPVGAITALVGAPFFAIIFISRRSN